MRKLIIIDDYKTLLEEQENQFEKVFGKDQRYQLCTMLVKQDSTKDDVVKNILYQIRVNDCEKAVVVVDWDYANANVVFNGEKILESISENLSPQEKETTVLILSTSMNFYDTKFLLVERKTVEDNEQQQVFEKGRKTELIVDITAFQQLLQRKNVSPDIVNNLVNKARERDAFCNYFVDIFSALVL